MINFLILEIDLSLYQKKMSKLSVLSNATPLSNGEINTLKFQGYLE